MKNCKKILFTLVSIIMLVMINTSLASARAHSSSSSSSSSSSRSYRRYYYDHDSNLKSDTSGFTEFALIIIIIFLIIYIKFNPFTRKKIPKAKFLKNIDIINKDCLTISNSISHKRNYWNEYELSKRVENTFYRVENAWSDMDIDSISSYLTPGIITAFKSEIDTLASKGKQNVLKNITLIDSKLIGVRLEKNDAKDMAYFLIKGSMKDYICKLNKKNTKKLVTTSKFIEVWKFVRKDETWVLDEIINKEDFPYRENEFNVIDNYNLL